MRVKYHQIFHFGEKTIIPVLWLG